MATLYYYTYNNYYNRRLKKEDTLEAYGTPIFIETSTNLNFNPNDGVNTEDTAGRYSNPYNGKADYAIYSEDNVNITSRWFIIEQTRKLKGQYHVIFRRDLLADYKDNIYNADAFIEKATLTENNPLIFNDEAMTVNQIKTSETLLKDETGCPWIVGYYSTNANNTTGTIMEINLQEQIHYDENIPGTFADWGYSKYTSEDMIGPTKILDYHLYAVDTSAAVAGGDIYSDIDYSINPSIGRASTLTYGPWTTNQYVNPYYTSEPKTANQIWSDFRSLGFSTLKQQFDQLVYTQTQTEVNILLSYNNKIVRFGDGAGGYDYYKFNVTQTTDNFSTDITEGQLYTTLRNKFDTIYQFVDSAPHAAFSVYYKGTHLRLYAEKLQVGAVKAKITTSNYVLSDAPYGMFAIPYGQVTIKNTGGFGSIDIIPETSYRVANEFAKNYSESGVLYDLQLLPYCPCRQIILPDGTMDINNNASLFSPITDEQNNILGVIFTCPVSSFTFDIPLNIPVVNKKMENQTDMYRLVSPNYNGQFEFSPAKNNGVHFINVDCTYLPYNPYIHMNPDFDLLYGQDFNDARGVILGGQFSLPIINDQFKAYEIQNKNYENVFKREILNMDTNRKYQRVQEYVGMGVNALSSGVNAGLLTGNVLAGVGAGVASLAGGLTDIGISEKLYNEAVDYKKDMHGFQLDNIRALPYSLGKTTAYTYNNKVFPIIEYYTCTDEEKKAFAKKIAYNGMTVGVIDKIINYKDNTWSYKDITDKGYIKARLIRIEGIDDDTHLLNNLADEVFKGFYTK